MTRLIAIVRGLGTRHHRSRCSWSKLMNKDQFKGKVDQLKGLIKETTGRLIGNQRLENEGKAQNATGDIQETVGDIKEDIKRP
jgi:uncharacterized protein YjbJ (UPF0337 family)